MATCDATTLEQNTAPIGDHGGGRFIARRFDAENQIFLCNVTLMRFLLKCTKTLMVA